MLVTNMLIMLFSVIFIGVGSTSLAYGQSFEGELQVYCIQKCAESSISKQLTDPVGCDCKPEPGKTTIPTVVFITPAVGLIVIGVFTFIGALLGCVGAIRERNSLIYMYCCILFLVIILQIGFGAAAASVASGNAKEIQAPLEGLLKKKYKEFDWENLRLFFPPACYVGKNKVAINSTDPVYQYPLCNFEGCEKNGTQAEQACCTVDFECNTQMKDCITGAECLNTFFGRAGAPVATMCFLPIMLELIAIVFACVNVFKRPSTSKGDFA